MKFVETAVETERGIEAYDAEKLITKFCLLSMDFHVNLCMNTSCNSCKFMQECLDYLLRVNSSAEEKIILFHTYCRNNLYQFYSLHCLLLSLAQVEQEKKNLDDSLKKLLLSQHGKQV